MKIQIISYCNNLANKFYGYDFRYSSINKPKSFDEFDVNMIFLSNPNIWESNLSEIKSSVNFDADFKSIREIIQNSKSAKTVLVFPQNCIFKYYFSNRENKLIKGQELKNVIDYVCEIINKMIPFMSTPKWRISYENTTTVIDENEYDAAFYFCSQYPALTLSKDSQKATTIRVDEKIYFTSMNLTSKESSINGFLRKIGLDNSKTDIPQWLIDLNCMNDEEQHQTVNKNNLIIAEAQKEIDKANKQLEENLKYKSILVSNGQELTKVVFEILEKILDCSVADFKDNGKEDFLIKKEYITFIGEIKGITSNVKSENVAQVERHYQAYMDELQEKGLSENVKQILIINPFRTKELSLRDEVHKIQIDLAKRYGSLIITTDVLLKVFEKFVNNELSTKKIVAVFTEKTGLLDIKQFE